MVEPFWLEKMSFLGTVALRVPGVPQNRSKEAKDAEFSFPHLLLKVGVPPRGRAWADGLSYLCFFISTFTQGGWLYWHKPP